MVDCLLVERSRWTEPSLTTDPAKHHRASARGSDEAGAPWSGAPPAGHLHYRLVPGPLGE